MQNKRSLQI